MRTLAQLKKLSSAEKITYKEAIFILDRGYTINSNKTFFEKDQSYSVCKSKGWYIISYCSNRDFTNIPCGYFSRQNFKNVIGQTGLTFKKY